jgi:hypothetical protein
MGDSITGNQKFLLLAIPITGITLCCIVLFGWAFIDGILRDFGVLPTRTPRPSDTPITTESMTLESILPTEIVSSAGVMKFMQGNNCTQDIVGETSDEPGKSINFKKTGEFTNDEARSVLLINVRAGTLLKVYDHPDGDMDDDWTEIVLKKTVSRYCIKSFEQTYEDEAVKILYHSHNGLDGKVSRIEIAAFSIAYSTQTNTSIPTDTPSPNNTPTIMLTSTRTSIPERTLIPSVTPTATATRTRTPAASLTPSITPTATASRTRTPTASPTSTPDTTAAMIFVTHYMTKSGETLNDVLMQKSYGTQVFGWYAEVCPVPICSEEGTYLVAFKYVYGMVSIPIWYVDNTISNIYFVNGKAKNYTPELPGAFIKGLVSDISAAFDLFEYKPKELGVLNP